MLIHTVAEFSSQSFFLILVLAEPYLHSGYVLVAKAELRGLASVAGPSPAPRPSSKSLTIFHHSVCCSRVILVCAQQGTFQKTMY